MSFYQLHLSRLRISILVTVGQLRFVELAHILQYLQIQEILQPWMAINRNRNTTLIKRTQFHYFSSLRSSYWSCMRKRCLIYHISGARIVTAKLGRYLLPRVKPRVYVTWSSMLPAFQSSDSVLPGYPPHPLSPPPATYSHPQWDLILLKKSELKFQQEKYLMDDKYPRVARAKQAQKFTDILIERWREMLRPIDKCDEGSLLLCFVQHVHIPSPLVLVACTTAVAPSTQLKEFKLLTSFLQQQSSDDCVMLLLQVLCEMHVYCLSRHPLQRAIGRYFVLHRHRHTHEQTDKQTNMHTHTHTYMCTVCHT